MAKWDLHSEMIPHSESLGGRGKREKKEIKLLVSELCLMVTDNSNFCGFNGAHFYSHFLRERKTQLLPPPRQSFNAFFLHSLNCLACWKTLKQQVICAFLWLLSEYPSLCFICKFFSVHLMMNGLLLPWEIFTCKTLYITSKANKTQTRYQPYQELHRRVHTSCYFKAHTFQTEQIKRSPEGGTGMKCLKTAAAFMLTVTIVYRRPSIN